MIFASSSFEGQKIMFSKAAHVFFIRVSFRILSVLEKGRFLTD